MQRRHSPCVDGGDGGGAGGGDGRDGMWCLRWFMIYLESHAYDAPSRGCNRE